MTVEEWIAAGGVVEIVTDPPRAEKTMINRQREYRERQILIPKRRKEDETQD